MHDSILQYHQPTLLAINNYHYSRGGAENVFLNQMRQFAAAGWQVVPFAMQHPDNLPSPWESHFVEEIELGRSYSLSQAVRRVPRVMYSLDARRRLEGLLDASRPDVAHLHNIYHHISPSILPVLDERRVPAVMTLHDFKLACPSYRMLAHDGVCERCRGGRFRNLVRHRCIKGSLALSGLVYLETRLHHFLDIYQRHVDRFICPSRFLMDKLVEWGMDRSQMVHIPNAVPLDDRPPRAHPGNFFVYLGRLADEKGVATLLRAVAEIGAELRLIGDGPERGPLEKRAHELDARVEFLGHVNDPQTIRAVLRDARALVLPSEWYENAPLSVLEAYAEGVPVIGARIGGIPEMIVPGETGSLFESGSVADLAEKLSDMLASSDDSVVRMGLAGRHLLASEFSPATHLARLTSLYESLGVRTP